MNSAQLHVVITGAVCLAMTAVLAALVRWVVIPLCDADEGTHARPRRWARMRRRLRAARYLPWEWWWTAGWRPGRWARRPRRMKEVMSSAPESRLAQRESHGLRIGVLRRRITPEAVQPMLPPLQGIGQWVTWGAVKARRGTLSPGLPGPRRLGVRSRLRRRALPPAGADMPEPGLSPEDTQTLTWIGQLKGEAVQQASPQLDYTEQFPLSLLESDTFVGGMEAMR